jgi:hypothetical protein
MCSTSLIAGPEPALPDDENETLGRPSECFQRINITIFYNSIFRVHFWISFSAKVFPFSHRMEETLINLYLSGYRNREVNAENSLENTCADGSMDFLFVFL